MDPEFYSILRLAAGAALLMMVPILIVSIGAGLLGGVLQTVTSIKEETVSYTLKLVALVLLITFLSQRYVDAIVALALQAWRGG